MSSAVFILTLVTALGCALVAGAFYAFSSFVMPALGRLAPGEGIAAMQAINVTAVMPAFMAAFVGSAVTSLASIVVSLTGWEEDYAPYLLAGGLLYLVGAFGLTIGYHVPRNDALAAVDPDSPDAGRDWARYLQAWMAGNHVRAAAALAAAAMMVLGVRAS